MANTFISTDPETKVQKIVRIPDGCIVVELSDDEFSSFMLEVSLDLFFEGDRNIVDFFPCPVKKESDIWPYVYHINDNITAVVVCGIKYDKWIDGKKKSFEKKYWQRQQAKELQKRKILLDEAYCIFYLLAKGKVSRMLLDLLDADNKYKNAFDRGEVFGILEKYNIDIAKMRASKPDSFYNKIRSEHEYNRVIVGDIETTDEDRDYLFHISSDILLEIIKMPPLELIDEYNSKELQKIEIACKQLVFKINLNQNADAKQLAEIQYYLKENPKSDVYFDLLDYYIQKQDESNLERVANEIIELNPEYADNAYKRLVNYYKTIGNKIKEIDSIERFISDYPAKDGYLNKRLVELGEREKNIIPPESHMDSTTIPITSLDVIDSAYPNYNTMWGISGSGYYAEGRRYETRFDYKQAVHIYETLIANGCKSTSPFGRLMAIYRKFKMYDDEIRVINLALNKYKKSELQVIDKWKKRLETVEKIKTKS
jgi:hypothetical protein